MLQFCYFTFEIQASNFDSVISLSVMKQLTQNEESKQVMQQYKRPLLPGLNPYAKGLLYISGIVLTVWASKFVFSAFAIRAFKDLRKSISENNRG
jgi:hypothetical protein